MHTITRRFEFDSAHRVLGHQGKCRHLHGHRYVAEVTVKQADDVLDGLGMVIDFAVIKERIGEWIDTNWDHNVILNKSDPLIGAFVRERAPYLFDDNPTAENIARHLFAVADKLLPFDLQVTQVRVYETPNCYSDYRP